MILRCYHKLSEIVTYLTSTYTLILFLRASILSLFIPHKFYIAMEARGGLIAQKADIHSNCLLADIGPECWNFNHYFWLVESPSIRLRTGCGVEGNLQGLGTWGMVARALKQLFNCIQRRERRKESLEVYIILVATRDPPCPCCSLPRWESNNHFSKISRQNRFHNLEEDHLLAHAQLPGTFPILLDEQFNILPPLGLIKIIVNIFTYGLIKPFLTPQK